MMSTVNGHSTEIYTKKRRYYDHCDSSLLHTNIQICDHSMSSTEPASSTIGETTPLIQKTKNKNAYAIKTKITDNHFIPIRRCDSPINGESLSFDEEKDETTYKVPSPCKVYFCDENGDPSESVPAERNIIKPLNDNNSNEGKTTILSTDREMQSPEKNQLLSGSTRSSKFRNAKRPPRILTRSNTTGSSSGHGRTRSLLTGGHCRSLSSSMTSSGHRRAQSFGGSARGPGDQAPGVQLLSSSVHGSFRSLGRGGHRRSRSIGGSCVADEGQDRFEQHSSKFFFNLFSLEKSRSSMLSTASYATIFMFIALLSVMIITDNATEAPHIKSLGPYRLLEQHTGRLFWELYDFSDGPALRSNGFARYTSAEKVFQLGNANVTTEDNRSLAQTLNYKSFLRYDRTEFHHSDQDFIVLKLSPTLGGPRNSIQLEGKKCYNRGLFIVDLAHMPTGCGIWPSIFLAGKTNYPTSSEISILEGINRQTSAKTTLYATKETCHMDDDASNMMTGFWDPKGGNEDFGTGADPSSLRTEVENCYATSSREKRFGEGCTAVDDHNDTSGHPLNAKGGGVYVLEWDPTNSVIRSWVFSPHAVVPSNLKDAMRTAGRKDQKERGY